MNAIQDNKKLSNMLKQAAKHISYYRPYLHVPFELWPVIDHTVLEDNADDFVSAKFKNVVELCPEDLFGLCCRHGKLCYPKTEYVIEPAWADESHKRFVPIVTTLNPKRYPHIRFRLKVLWRASETLCECQDTHFVIDGVSGSTDEIIYVPHLFEKRSLPIFPDEMENLFETFPEIQKYQIEQQTLNRWVIHCLTPDLKELESKLQDSLSHLLFSKQLQMPKVLFQSWDKARRSAPGKVVKSFG